MHLLGFVHGIDTILVSNWEQKMLYQNTMQRRTPWNWFWKVLKCKKEIYQIEFKKQMSKTGSFTPRVIVMKVSKMAHFLFFCWWQQPFKCTWKVLLSWVFLFFCFFFPEKVMVNRFWSYHSWDIQGRHIRNCWVSKKKNPLFSRIDMLLMVTKNPVTHNIFTKNQIRPIRCM